VWSEVCNQIITASPAERHANPRSTSAKLRWARR
jgi:16S rRNA C1402 N4-methylase RsmH